MIRMWDLAFFYCIMLPLMPCSLLLFHSRYEKREGDIQKRRDTSGRGSDSPAHSSAQWLSQVLELSNCISMPASMFAISFWR
ncbi:hypothetical protein Y1Q_0016511 [Alligator mississippiensis]|uniref:Uncharacterized protein n=1 Tax=Alligator mississippiensis TaxID=8496 RepID=A0A151N2X2_ALLMI|nr:hypothetical protein Y1Q_0016511 [Alligator mississippiensis]